MGSGVSNLDSHDKEMLYKTIESRYVVETNKIEKLAPDDQDKSEKERELELFKTLSDAYEEGLRKCKSANNNNDNISVKPIIDDPSSSSNTPSGTVSPSSKFVSPKRQVSNRIRVENGEYTPVDVITHANFDIDSDFETSDAAASLNVLKPSVDLIEGRSVKSGQTPADHINYIAESFASKIKSGDIVAQETTEFRSRRLTYNMRSDSNPIRASSPSPTKLTRKRTSIFSSSEIGYVQEKKSPFPPDCFGTYSCHGIEPSLDGSGSVEKINQDRGCCCYPFNSSTEQALFLVLDGHGNNGDQISEFTMRQLVVSLEKHPNLSEAPMIALKESIIKTHEALTTTGIECLTSGCTLVAIYVSGSKLYVANVGDSRAVLASFLPRSSNDPAAYSFVAKDLTKDHKPDDPVEMARIVAYGGFVKPAPEVGLSARVYLDAKLTMIGLAMSRSIGDFAVKNVGVIPDPEVFEYFLEPEDSFIILASDGVWEFITSQEAVNIVADAILVTEATYTNSSGVDCKKDSALVGCQNLIQEAALIWQDIEGDYRDDITAIVIRLPLFNRFGGGSLCFSSQESSSS